MRHVKLIEVVVRDRRTGVEIDCWATVSPPRGEELLRMEDGSVYRVTDLTWGPHRNGLDIQAVRISGPPEAS